MTQVLTVDPFTCSECGAHHRNGILIGLTVECNSESCRALRRHRALRRFSDRWHLDGDYIRCRHCKRAHLMSWAALPFEHIEGCPHTAPDQHPWYELQGLLRSLPEHTPKPRHVHTLVYEIGYDGVACTHCDFRRPTPKQQDRGSG